MSPSFIQIIIAIVILIVPVWVIKMTFTHKNKVVHPWRRYFARLSDTIINGLLGAAVFFVSWSLLASVSFTSFIEGSLASNGIFMSAVISFMAMLVNGLSIGVCGNTLGKWLFGIKVRHQDQSKLTIRNAINREWAVLVWGLGFGIPVINLIMSWKSLRSLQDAGITSWDKDLAFVVQHQNWGALHWMRAIIGFSIVIVAMGILNASS